jgi:glyoxylase I family protein
MEAALDSPHVQAHRPHRARHGKSRAHRRLLELAYLELGGTTVELMSYPEADPAPREPGERLGWRLMALEVDDMDAALAYLKGKGIEASWGPKKAPDYARAEIRDPDGNAIELRQWIRG